MIGDYFRTQFETLVAQGSASRHKVEVVENCRVTDIIPRGDHLTLELANASRYEYPVFIDAAFSPLMTESACCSRKAQ